MPTQQSFLTIGKNSPFPLNNLPYGVFRCSQTESFRVGVAIGDYVLDLALLEKHSLLKTPKTVFASDSLNPFMELGFDHWWKIRQQLQHLLNKNTAELRDNSALLKQVLCKYNHCEFKLPMQIPDYTDFFASEQHAINTGKMFRPDQKNSLLPNWKHMPIAYHGRTSSIVLTGSPIIRPHGQILTADNVLTFAASRRLDFEVELGFIIGTGNALGQSINVNEAHKHVFGAILVNDWSARDIQRWEYQPLGPFLGKSFATSLSPWVVSMFALEDFHTKALEQDVPVLNYLQENQRFALDIDFKVELKTKEMTGYEIIANTNSKYIYWSYAQMLAHHTINGCNLRTGDLLASGTISGPEPHQFGSMLELSWAGQKPFKLPNDICRSFLEDGDSVKISAQCQNNSDLNLGFADVEGTVVTGVTT